MTSNLCLRNPKAQFSCLTLNAVKGSCQIAIISGFIHKENSKAVSKQMQNFTQRRSWIKKLIHKFCLTSKLCKAILFFICYYIKYIVTAIQNIQLLFYLTRSKYNKYIRCSKYKTFMLFNKEYIQ